MCKRDGLPRRGQHGGSDVPIENSRDAFAKRSDGAALTAVAKRRWPLLLLDVSMLIMNKVQEVVAFNFSMP